MKKLYLISILFLPLGAILASCVGYAFELELCPLFAVLTAILAVILCLNADSYKDRDIPVWEGSIYSIIGILTVMNYLFYLYQSRTLAVVFGLMITIVCSFYLTYKFGTKKVMNIISYIVTGLAIIPLVSITFFSIVFGNIGTNRIVDKIYSPDQTRYAAVIDSDQGAFGGSTLVDVYENQELDLGILKFYKKPERVFRGEWGIYEEMEIEWINDEELMINSKKYYLGS